MHATHSPLTNFNPRSVAGATAGIGVTPGTPIISIHAPLRERLHALEAQAKDAIISIHAPLRERLKSRLILPSVLVFQSTLPCGSDKAVFDCDMAYEISIHAPLRERLLLLSRQIITLAFQSTLPCGSDEAKEKILKHRQISIHAPLRERRLKKGSFEVIKKYFNPRSLAGATLACKADDKILAISIHAPLRERRYQQQRQRD